MTTEPKIEQVDRMAAAAYLLALVPTMPNLAEKVKSDQSALARLFARHRALGKQEGRQELLAEVLAWLRAYRGWESIVSTAQFFADALAAKFG